MKVNLGFKNSEVHTKPEVNALVEEVRQRLMDHVGKARAFAS